jgi:glycogen(starch) synthase
MARPVVAARVGGLPEIVVHGHTGLLVEGEDVGELAGAIISLLGDSGRMAEMGRSARDRAAKLFSWKSYVDAYDSLYSDLGARSRHR